MTDHDPNEATVFGGPAVPPPPGAAADATRATAAYGPGGPTGGTPIVPGPPPGGMDRRVLWALGALGVALLALVLVLLLGGDDDDEITTGTSTTISTLPSTTGSTTTTTVLTTSTTVAPTTTAATSPAPTTTATAAPTTTTSTAPTTTAPPATIAPDRCTGLTDADDPEPTAKTFYDAWRIGDEDCAREIATDEAIDTLFAYPPNGPDWVFQGCTEVEDPDPYTDCAYTYDGGSAHFSQNYGNEFGWNIFEVTFVAD